MVERIEFSRVEAETITTIRRLKPVDLLGVDRGFARYDKPVGIFGRIKHAKSSLIAIVEFEDIFDLSGNRFYND